MTKISVELDIDQFDKLVVEELIRTRAQFLNDLGANNHVFVYGDQEEDDADQLITWFGTPEQIEEVYGVED